MKKKNQNTAVKNITSHLLEWLLQKKEREREITSVGYDVEKRELWGTVAKNVKLVQHCGKQYGTSSKNYKQNYHRFQQFHFCVYMQRK